MFDRQSLHIALLMWGFSGYRNGTISGIEVAKQLKIWNPKVNIIFVTGYNQYMAEAFRLRVSGYVGKPAPVEEIREELEGLRIPVLPKKITYWWRNVSELLMCL